MSDEEQQPDGHKLPTIRGPRLDLPPHPQSCDLSELRSFAKKCRRPIAIDLFCGAGGLSLGLQRAGFDVILGIDKDQFAIETHRAHFSGASVQKRLDEPGGLQPIFKALRGVDVSLVAGGPPCQPFSMPVRWRRRSVRHAEKDARRELWLPFLEVVTKLRPRAVLMENVPDLARNADGVILRNIIERLVKLGYSVTADTFPAYYFGVPQVRTRLFVVALLEPRGFVWPAERRNADGTVAALRDAIGDLPAVEAGWTSVPAPYDGPQTELQKILRTGMPNSSQLWDHVTRAVRGDDLEAFRLMDSTTKYPDLPAHLKRYDDQNFTDKYNRLAWDKPSRAITAHLSRDGYWYIHPEQHRTLTVREAARIQSFPDRFRFAGFTSSALRQIGEAVAPLVAEGLGKVILDALKAKRKRADAIFVSRANFPRPKLEAWLDKEPTNNLSMPWRRTGNIWLVLLGEFRWPTFRSGPESFSGQTLSWPGRRHETTFGIKTGHIRPRRLGAMNWLEHSTRSRVFSRDARRSSQRSFFLWARSRLGWLFRCAGTRLIGPALNRW